LSGSHMLKPPALPEDTFTVMVVFLCKSIWCKSIGVAFDGRGAEG
jgi:hypothetical protein